MTTSALTTAKRKRQYTRDFGDDAPDVKNWTWPY